MRAAEQRRLRRVAVQQFAGGDNLARRGDRVDARARQPLVLLQKQLGAPEPVRVIVAVVQAGQPQELVGDRLVAGQRLADRLLVSGGARVSLHQFEMRFELGPARKTELARDDQ